MRMFCCFIIGAITVILLILTGIASAYLHSFGPQWLIGGNFVGVNTFLLCAFWLICGSVSIVNISLGDDNVK